MALDFSRLFQPVLAAAMTLEARRLARSFHGHLADFRRVQERCLLAKIRRNAASDFGRRYDFARIRSVDDFRRAVPVSRYEDYTDYVDQVRHGRVEAMFSPRQRIFMFAMTSGTTDRPKYVPVTEEFLAEYRRGWMIWGLHAFLAHPAAFKSRILQLVSPMDDELAPSGLPCGAMSGLTAQAQRRAARNVYVLPPCVARIKDTPSKYYVAMLLALRDRRLVLFTANPSTLLGLARLMDQRKDELLRDLCDGGLRAEVNIPDEVRRDLADRLKANPGRAGELVRRASQSGRLVPGDVWEFPFLGCWKGGTLSLYLREFVTYYGQAPIRDIGLIASEGRMTVPLTDGSSAGPLDAESTFFEFLPAHDGQATSSEPLLPHELEVGQDYFILLTNSAGFYRYNIGDLVRCEGFEGGSPRVEFLSKGSHYSSLTGEKISEFQVVEAVNAALAERPLQLASYCLAPTWSGGAPHYVLIVEQAVAADLAALREFLVAVDRRLQVTNIEYQAKRSSGRLGPIRAKVVAAGAWQKFDMQVIAERRRGIEQYKHKFLVGDVEFEKRFEALAGHEL